ncbi:hypothetical protein T265_04272 [Opisthorchis viverrini]|uniref:Uncharacterized protein n=1 Tax=Opisthorchis viverrini TaxID=6198 RepID=A0A074ZPB6_OPIVI|nr:hypothetical protein T265_04272 [Opisthorchis viverrini]KER28976.1 hypothetical protein T265_04272 [Opisthorchis viverrini]
MSLRMVTKRLQVNCQARRTDQQPPLNSPELPIFRHITKMMKIVVVSLFAVLGSWIANVSSPIGVTSSVQG